MSRGQVHMAEVLLQIFLEDLSGHGCEKAGIGATYGRDLRSDKPKEIMHATPARCCCVTQRSQVEPRQLLGKA